MNTRANRTSAADSFLWYEVVRRILLLGLRMKPILDAPDVTEPNVRILDVGCGFGHLARQFIHCDYTGIDIDAERIQVVGEHDRRRFIVGDVCHMNLPSKGFDKAIGYGILHHLSDHDASRLLGERLYPRTKDRAKRDRFALLSMGLVRRRHLGGAVRTYRSGALEKPGGAPGPPRAVDQRRVCQYRRTVLPRPYSVLPDPPVVRYEHRAVSYPANCHGK